MGLVRQKPPAGRVVVAGPLVLESRPGLAGTGNPAGIFGDAGIAPHRTGPNPCRLFAYNSLILGQFAAILYDQPILTNGNAERVTIECHRPGERAVHVQNRFNNGNRSAPERHVHLDGGTRW